MCNHFEYKIDYIMCIFPIEFELIFFKCSIFILIGIFPKILYSYFPDMSHVSVVVIGGDQDDTLTKVMDSSLETNNHSSSSSQVN